MGLNSHKHQLSLKEQPLKVTDRSKIQGISNRKGTNRPSTANSTMAQSIKWMTCNNCENVKNGCYNDIENLELEQIN